MPRRHSKAGESTGERRAFGKGGRGAAQPLGAVATWGEIEAVPAGARERHARPEPLTIQRGTVVEADPPTTREVVSPGAAPRPATGAQRQLENLDVMTVAIEQSIHMRAMRPPKRKSFVQRTRITARKATIYGLRIVAGLALIYLVMSGTHGVMALPPDMRVMHGNAADIGTAPLSASAATNAAKADSGPQVNMSDVTSRVQAFTQMRRSDLYDNVDQFNAWGGSACSAAVTAEILTAYGARDATIGHIIDAMGDDISLQWGLETYDGFQRAASAYGFRADLYVDHPLTYNQMKYLTNTLHIPVIVNVRATSGYYHYLSGGHFLVMTGGDNSNIQLVDSSLYYIKSLSLGTFDWMFRNRTAVIVPKDYHYTLPNS
ncbi:MAG TPA: hypothetical protein VF807_15810 [Ktedonobacterales bacterium]